MRNKNKSNRNAGNPFPSVYQAHPTIKRKIRYVSTATVGTAIVYRNCLLSLIGADSSTASSVAISFLIASIRIKKVEVWQSVSDGSGSFDTVSLVWHSQFGKDVEITATGNPMRPAHFVARPPAMSAASFWSVMGSNETEKIMSIHYGDTSFTLDLTFEYTMADGLASYGTMSTTLAVANIVYFPLDCISVSSTGGTNLLVASNLTTNILTARTAISPQNAQ